MDNCPCYWVPLHDRLRAIFKYGSLSKLLFVSPDLAAPTRKLVKELGFASPVSVMIHWPPDTIIGWDREHERPDVPVEA